LAGLTWKDVMVKHSPHKRWKGHCIGLCAPHKIKGNGLAEKTPWRELRKLGLKRRVSRRSLGDDN
jgi:hypothetical protein